MSPENDEELCRKYPMLYAQRRRRAQETCMCWGFDCGDGWKGIIDAASARLEEINRSIPDDQPKVEAVQVKEKFGGLRIYTGSVPSSRYDEIRAIIGEAEGKSLETCESCGKPGGLRGGSWVFTMCDDCFRARERRATT
jgi:hypothetical protein